MDGCTVEFVPRRESQKCCCEAHGKARWYHDPANAAVRGGDRSWTDKRRDDYHRRRARKAGTATGAPVRLADVLERDGWVCHLCDVAIPPDADYPDPLSASLDHVIPLSREGIHDPSNVAPAHLQCNVQKGNKIGAA